MVTASEFVIVCVALLATVMTVSAVIDTANQSALNGYRVDFTQNPVPHQNITINSTVYEFTADGTYDTDHIPIMIGSNVNDTVLNLKYGVQNTTKLVVR